MFNYIMSDKSVTYKTEILFLLIEWKDRKENYLARGHDLRTERSEVPVS